MESVPSALGNPKESWRDTVKVEKCTGQCELWYVMIFFDDLEQPIGKTRIQREEYQCITLWVIAFIRPKLPAQIMYSNWIQFLEIG